MKRAAQIHWFTIPILFCEVISSAQPCYVSPSGGDANPGTVEKPFATLQRAQLGVRCPADRNKINFSIEGDDKITGFGRGLAAKPALRRKDVKYNNPLRLGCENVSFASVSNFQK
ncbi:MAG TPA: hypothetical protein VMV89_12955 [Candidatus Paceibacterota bacterium]|nr:hypothetical protein [Candidatus Paceibacterota bacterium]